MIFAPDTNSVARPHETFVDCYRDWQLADDLDGGVDRMRFRALHCSQQWLPKEELEELTQYKTRVMRSDLYPGFSQGLDDAMARPFAKPVQVTVLEPETEATEQPDPAEPEDDNDSDLADGGEEDGKDPIDDSASPGAAPAAKTKPELPPEFDLMLQDIDGDGSDITQFLAHFMRSACKHGMAHAWVDFPPATPSNGATQTKADDMKAGRRAWWTIIPATHLFNWRSMTLPSGKRVLSEVYIHELRDGGEFIRILRTNSFEVWRNKAYEPPRRKEGDDLEGRFYAAKEYRREDFELESSGPYGPEGGFTEGLPIVTVYTGYQGFMRAKPPFKALAETNVIHWQSSSDQRNIAHFCRVPILFARGIEAESLKGAAIGAGSVLSTQNLTGDLRFVEHSGGAMALGQEDLDRLERRMEQLGVRPHIERMQGATATGVAINADGADTDVQAWAQAIDTACEQCFTWTARWLGNEKLAENIDVQIFKDYQVAYKGTSDVSVLQADVDKGRIRPETYLKEIQRRGVLGDDVDIDAEVAHAQHEVERKRKIAESIAAGTGNTPGEPGKKPGESGTTPPPPNPGRPGQE